MSISPKNIQQNVSAESILVAYMILIALTWNEAAKMSQTDYKLVRKYCVVNNWYFDLITSVAITLFFTILNLKATKLTFIFSRKYVNQRYIIGAIISSPWISDQHLAKAILMPAIKF